MRVTKEQRQALLIAERGHHPDVIRQAIATVMEQTPGVSALDIEMVFRDANAATFLVSRGAGQDNGDDFKICTGVRAARDALAESGLTFQQNRAALAAIF